MADIKTRDTSKGTIKTINKAAVKLAQEIGGHKAARELGIPKGTMVWQQQVAFQNMNLSV